MTYEGNISVKHMAVIVFALYIVDRDYSYIYN